MEDISLTPEDLDRLSTQIDVELQELSRAPATAFKSLTPESPALAFPEKQLQAIETAVGEPAASFLAALQKGRLPGPLPGRRPLLRAVAQVARPEQ